MRKKYQTNKFNRMQLSFKNLGLSHAVNHAVQMMRIFFWYATNSFEFEFFFSLSVESKIKILGQNSTEMREVIAVVTANQD